MPKIDPRDYVDISHGAELAGCSREHIRKLALRGEAGGVGGIEIDGHWFVRRDLASRLSVHPTMGKAGSGRKKR
jgi:hypothetical protein